jgi:hypothetical protein
MAQPQAQAAPAAPRPTPINHVALVVLQRMTGAWEAGDALFAELQLESAQVPRPSSAPSADAWTTALVLAVLETRCADLRSEWAPAAAKGRRWLTSQVGSRDEVTALVEAAKRAIAGIPPKA